MRCIPDLRAPARAQGNGSPSRAETQDFKGSLPTFKFRLKPSARAITLTGGVKALGNLWTRTHNLIRQRFAAFALSCSSSFTDASVMVASGFALQ